ncbi:MAG: serine/threonine protein kinase [Deltaproteobacteria bacterium]|nr:serine/threonine protein kinase [Deltaproteobacteria bacterium]
MEGLVLGGKYRLLRPIAEGGMGVVWEAEHVQIGRKLAVKVLQGHLAKNPEAVLRFQREAQIAGTLGHDHICPVLDIGETETGQHYLVMELLRGRSLGETLEASGALAVDRALDIAGQILDALAAAHSAGVVHRDLKPGNVFLSRVGDRDDFVRVLDFGISKVTSDGGQEATSLTRTGIVMGTAHYMAPEQARGHRDIDSRVDLYATGAILYEMLTGRVPYDGESSNEIIIKLATEPFVPPREHRPDLPEEVQAIVLRAMARRREDRFATAAEMREKVLGARSTLGASDQPAHAAMPPAVASPSTLIGVARSSPAPLATAPSASFRAWRLPRSRLPLVAAALALVAAAVGLVVWLGGGERGEDGGGEAHATPAVHATPFAPAHPATPAPSIAASPTPPPPTHTRHWRSRCRRLSPLRSYPSVPG